MANRGDDMMDEREHQDTIRVWGHQQHRQKKCQFCKQERDCKCGPDPFLLFNFDEVEMVWLCDDCYDIRAEGLHLPDDEDLE